MKTELQWLEEQGLYAVHWRDAALSLSRRPDGTPEEGTWFSSSCYAGAQLAVAAEPAHRTRGFGRYLADRIPEFGIKDPNGYALILGEDNSKKWALPQKSNPTNGRDCVKTRSAVS